MPRTSPVLLCLLLLFGVVHAAPAASQEADGAEHVARARKLFEDRKFVEAAESLRAAYDVSPNPLYLFNAGQSYRKAEAKAQALEMYRRFLKEAPEHKLAPEAEGYVSELESALALQERLSSIKLELEAERAESDEAQRQAQKERQRAEAAQRALEKERKKPWYKKPWFYGLLGSVIGVVGIGALAGGLSAIGDPRRSVNAADLNVQF